METLERHRRRAWKTQRAEHVVKKQFMQTRTGDIYPHVGVEIMVFLCARIIKTH